MSLERNAWRRAYRQTKRGFLCDAYSGLRSRALGQSSARHIYKGLAFLPRQVFYMWAVGNNEFHRLWDAWKAAGGPRGLTPSVDRKNPLEGYVLDNIQWLTQSDNCAKADHNGERSGSAKLTEIQVREIRQSTLSNRTIARVYGVGKSTISAIRTRETWAHI